MERKETVVVAVPLSCMSNADKTEYVSRIHVLGLTAYANSLDEAQRNVKRMFAKWVDLNRRSGTLEENLTKSGLTWYYESEYVGTSPYERVLPNGDIEQVNPRSRYRSTWNNMERAVVAS